EAEETKGQRPMVQAPFQLSQISSLEPVHQEIIAGGLKIPKEQEAQNRRDRQSQEQRSTQSKSISIRHRPKNLPFRSLHRKQGNESTNHDGGRKKQLPLDLVRSANDPVAQPQLRVFSRADVPVD